MQRIGPHVQNVARVNPAGWAWIRSSSIVKEIDGTLALRQANPSAIRVYRKYYQHQDVAAQMGGELLAREIIDSLHGYRHPLLYCEFPFNEWRSGLDELSAHIGLLEQGVPVFHAAGIRVCGYNFPTGGPADYVEAWDYIKARKYGGLTKDDAIGQHCYFGECGPLASTWNGRRFEIDHNLLGDGHVPLLLTEVGRDGVKEDNSAGKPGWHLQNITREQYVVELLAYDDLLARTPYVLGACLFTLGANDDWRQFEVDSIAEMFPVSADVPKLKEESMPDKLPECGNEFDPSPNCDDRPKPTIEGIVIHDMEGSFDAARAWFKNTASQVSAHYLLRKDGYLLQMVPEGKRAWHAGTKAADKTGLWGAADFNGISVGIELEGFAGQPYTDIQYEILRTLTWYLAKKYSIPYDRQHVVAHSELSRAKGDPGNQFQWWRLFPDPPKPAVVDWQVEAGKLQAENTRLHSIIDAARGILTT